MERSKNYWWLRIVLLLCLFLGMMTVMRMTAANVARLSGGQGIIDLTFGISPERVRAALTKYNGIYFSASILFMHWCTGASTGVLSEPSAQGQAQGKEH